VHCVLQGKKLVTGGFEGRCKEKNSFDRLTLLIINTVNNSSGVLLRTSAEEVRCN